MVWSPRSRLVRALVALVLATVTGGRGGGIALACESIAVAASQGQHAMAGMPGMADHTPTHDASSGDGCDSSDRTRECPLMIACAPALLAAASDADEMVVGTRSVFEWRAEPFANALRQPEPPPPRA